MADFTTGQLISAKVKAARIWADNPTDQDIVVSTETVRAIRDQQTARLAEIQDPRKPDTMSVHVLDTSLIVEENCVDSCDITGPKLDDTTTDVAIDLCKKSSFSIDEESLRMSMYSDEEVIARGQLKATAVLDRWLNKQAAAKLKLFSDANVFPGAGNTYATGVTTIPAAKYSYTGLMSYFVRVAAQNRMGTPFLIDGGELFDSYLNADWDKINGEGAGNGARLRVLKTYFDLFGFADAGLTEDTFMVKRGQVAALHKNYHDVNQIKEIGGQVQVTEFTVASQNIPGIIYDATMTTTCTAGGPKGRKYSHAFEYRLHAGIFEGPTLAANPNVLAFAKGA